MKQLAIEKIRVKLGRDTSLNFSSATINFNNSPLVLIRGQNGSGKTTLLNLFGGYLKPKSGHILLNDELISGQGVRWSNNYGIVRGFQFPLLSGELTVWENIALPLMLKWWHDPYKYRSLITCRLEELGLESCADSSPAELSFGQRRIVEMVRIEMQLQRSQPKLLLLDEPFAGLDTFRRGKVIDIISKILDSNVPTIIVEHDARFERLMEIATEMELIFNDSVSELQLRRICTTEH